MNIEMIGLDELNTLYQTCLQRDFPPSELRPYSSMIRLMKQGDYRCFLCRNNGEVLGYALFVVSQGAALLDYFAMEPACRGRGLGTAFLARLQELARTFGVPYLLIEAESMESAKNTEETEERRRRLSFYRHCGCLATDVYSMLFGVEYQILALPLVSGDPPAPEQVKADLESLYRMIVPPLVDYSEQQYSRVCRCFLRPRDKEKDRHFAREMGRAVTYLYRNRSRFLTEYLREYGFSGAMYMILLHVDRHPGTTQDSIATHMYIDKSNVARRIKQLEELGFVRRETDLSDRRQNNLYLTDRGRELVPLIKNYLSEWGQSITSNLSQEERETLLSLLDKITGHTGK